MKKNNYYMNLKKLFITPLDLIILFLNKLMIMIVCLMAAIYFGGLWLNYGIVGIIVGLVPILAIILFVEFIKRQTRTDN